MRLRLELGERVEKFALKITSQEFEVPDHTKEGAVEFYKTTHDESYILELWIYGPFVKIEDNGKERRAYQVGKLHSDFESAIIQLGFAEIELPVAVFYNAPFGIRFEIGGKESVYLPHNKGINPIYLNNAFNRAKALLDGLPCRPNILRIDRYPENSDGVTMQVLLQIGLPLPDETVRENRIDGDDCYIQEHLYWDLTKGSVQVDKLLLEIMKGDIGGFSCLCSNVYLVNTECGVLYHLYDDRGADIVAEKKTSLLPLYRKYQEWILQYDKEKIDRIFSD